jgi:hypothetical protein
MKIIISLIIFIVTINAEVIINKQYVDRLVNYSLELPKHIDNPFIMQVIQQPKKVYIKDILKVEKQPVFVEKKLELLAVLNNKALVRLENNNLTKWLKQGDKIDEYTLKKIINSKSILVSVGKKMKIITIKNKFNIKVAQ